MRLPSKSLAAALFLATSAAFLAGCPSKPKYPECKTDPDCAEQKQVCVEGTCKECRDDKQCKEGFVCKGNACVPKPQCAENKDCPAGQKCTDGKCAAECSSAADCGDGKKCLAGRCSDADACNADGDCGDGKSCVNGRCGVKQVSCGGDDDCPADSACVDGVCKSGAARRVRCDTKPVHFGYDQATIGKSERAALDGVAQCLQKSGAKKIKVEGHCDERGTTEYNLALGSRRANAVKNYLQKLASGLEIETESYGSDRPVDKGHDEAAWAKNRRAEIVPEK
jgi:peptidoglycan-associated lipoprotein